MMTRHMLTVRQDENTKVREQVNQEYKETKRLRTKVLQARERLSHLQTLGKTKKGDSRKGDLAVHNLATACEDLHEKLSKLRTQIAEEDADAEDETFEFKPSPLRKA